MADQIVSDAVLHPHDEGLPNISDGDEDWNSAGLQMLLGQAVQSGSYVRSDTELTFTGHDGTNDTVDVTRGVAYLDLSGETVTVQSERGGSSPAAYDSDLATSVMPAICVIVPTTQSGVALQDSTSSSVWLAYATDGTVTGVSAGDVYLRSDDTGSVSSPPHPSVELGSVNPDDAGVDSLASRFGSPEFGSVEAQSVSTDKETITSDHLKVWYPDGTTDTFEIPSRTPGTGDIGGVINEAFASDAAGFKLPAGVYEYSTDIVPSNKATFEGQGGRIDGTDLFYSGSGTAIDFGTNGVGNSTLRDINITKTGTQGVGTGIKTGDGGNHLERVRSSGFNIGWETVTDDYYTVALNSTFVSNATAGVSGGANALNFIGCNFNGNPGDGLLLDDTTNGLRACNIIGCSIEANDGYGALITGTSQGSLIAGNYIEDNGSGGSGDGIFLSSGTGTTIAYNYFNNHDAGRSHVAIGGATGTTVGPNRYEDTNGTATDQAIVVSSGANDTHIAFGEETRIDGAATAINDVGARTTRGGVGQEATGGSVPADDWPVGSIVEDTDNAGDAWLLLPGGTWTQIGT